MSIRAPKGTDDILPPASNRWRAVLRTWDRLTECYGYEFVVTPLFEHAELFTRTVGPATDVVEKQMYTFEDRAGRRLALRPEQTASIVRAHLQSGRRGVFKAAGWGPMFRYEQPQAGRRRQFYQLDVEYIGEESPDADVEVVEIGYRFLEDVGVTGISVAINSIGAAADRLAFRTLLQEHLRSQADELSPAARLRIESNPLRVLDSKADRAVLADAPAPVDHLSADSARRFAAVCAGLDRIGIPYELDRRLVRGLDYYTHTVFEYVAAGYEAAQNAVGGGGRYDGLAELLGGPPTPGVGVAMGLDRILLAAGHPDATPALDVWVVVVDREHRSAALDLVTVLRRNGLRVDVDLGERSVKAQFKAADRRGAARAVVVGDEWRDGKVTVRDLTSGQQRLEDIPEVESWMS